MGWIGTRGLQRAKRTWAKRSFDRVACGILNTPPLPQQGDSPLFLSQVCHRDVAMYLLAIKSLYAGVGCGSVAAIDDGSLSPADRAILRDHIPGLMLFDIAAIDTGACPRGGTWERLVKIIELSRERYVIQADADTLVCGAIPEVVECWRANRSFLLGTGSGRAIAPAPAVASMVQGWIDTHGWTELTVGVAAEASLDKLPHAAEQSYVHASSGFAGFARGAFSLDQLERFSLEMSKHVGARWTEWGTEQIASNYVLANAPDAGVLPFPRYACFEPHLSLTDHAFLHFLGAYRYDNGVYRQHAREVISRYKEAPVYQE